MKNKKTRKIGEVNIAVCLYHFDGQKDRYVFFFYKNRRTKPFKKWIYYLVDNNIEDFKEKYTAEIKSFRHRINDNITLYMCTKDTHVNIVRMPHTFKYKVLAHRIIENDLMNRFGDDVSDKFYINNEEVEKIRLTGEKYATSTKEEKQKISHDNKHITTYQQVLAPRQLLHNTRVILAKLGLYMEQLESLPSSLYEYHTQESKNNNELIIYNEANFSIVSGIVNNKIVDNIYLEGSTHTKIENGTVVNYHLQRLSNVVASMLWQCQKEGCTIENVTLISNSERKTDDFKAALKSFGFKYTVVSYTDSIFGDEKDLDTLDDENEQASKNQKKEKKEKKAKKAKKGFTLVETVAAMAIFTLTVSVAAIIMLNTSKVATTNNNLIKVNNYLNNVYEVMRSEDDILLSITNSSEVEGSYYLNNNLEVFSADQNPIEDGYKVSYLFSSEEIKANETLYTFQIKEITLLDNDKPLVTDKEFKVIK